MISMFYLILGKLHDASLKPQTLFHEMLSIALHSSTLFGRLLFKENREMGLNSERQL